MRLFIALDLPTAIRNELAELQAAMRLPSHPVRWVEPGNMHLTLQFLGETPATDLAGLKAALQHLPEPEFDLRLGSLGAFPHVYYPEVIWAGLAGELAPLHALQASVCAATAALGLGRKKATFRPHITLGRVRQGVNQLRLEALGSTIERHPPPRPLSWPSGRPILFESTLTPQGALYTRP
ncbi:RNA 2',3'-cyclic phosphodiesterase [Candidatus Viridilinea mediisalina]|uniref:RNA 2',3'-cyclic phosphodiesterase n=1 Tax=Candidatus Viridilinea mediisalina TaxID=2024553 RepID=A0A2A6RIT7_9CHLR|nr:RNA 2',3'-cyclic phosphodiesterase [Candidatus Viridilinea mediisalina]PDW02987.1 RNA 2',3'-cyclic phosphodiesterase [Candidatus Viridilinea mediisalina]